jgi:hypothetical protein
MDEVYQEELREIGFSDSDIKELTRITNQLAVATSNRERDLLMYEYHELVEGTPYAAASSIYSPKGGTLNLEYTGSLSAISNVIFTKVIYLPSEQVVYYQKAINSSGFMDWVVGEGIGVVTTVAASKIASYLGITSSGLTWLIGLPIQQHFLSYKTWRLWT